MLDKVILGDCLATLKKMESESVDCIVTDPPYGLIARNTKGEASGGFMGRGWDKAVPPVEVWKECLRVLKPGCFAFVMSIPRQDCQAKMILNLQEAGFDISYSPIFWAQAQGFPKSANLSKLADKRAKTERKVVGKRPGTYADIKRNQETGQDSLHGGIATERPRVECLITAPASPEAKGLEGAYTCSLKPAVEIVLVVQKPITENTYIGQALRWYNQRACVVCGYNEWEAGRAPVRLDCGCYMCDECALSGEAIDHDCKPRTVGMGGLWLDNGRIPYENDNDREVVEAKCNFTEDSQAIGFGTDETVYGEGSTPLEQARDCVKPAGRFAPNLLVSDSILDTGKITKSGVTIQPEFVSTNAQGFQPNPKAIPGVNQHADSGDFSRFFDLDAWAKHNLPTLKTYPFAICSKPSPREKNAGLDDLPDKQMYKCDNSGESLEIFGTTDGGRKLRKNIHPTCKSLALMSYLIMLSSREGDIVLDPYLGSGTTACSAVILNRHYIGCELDPEYVDIAERRIAYHVEQKRNEQPKLFDL